jgi:hypothetical protein
MVNKAQAEAIGTAILLDAKQKRREPDKERTSDRAAWGLVFAGMGIGALTGVAACYLLTGRFTPGGIIGQGFGGGIGALARVYFSNDPSKRLKRVFAIVACIFFLLGVMPLLVLISRHLPS